MESIVSKSGPICVTTPDRSDHPREDGVAINASQPTSPQPVRSVLKNVDCFCFDLDDTLHEFRRASRASVNAIMESIAKEFAENGGPSIEELKAKYAKILADKTASAFVDGKTSHQYREDRFRATLKAFEIEPTDAQVSQWVSLYENVLMQALELKPGVIDLFNTLKSMGKKIAIITEGPQDAQERTIAKLGLAPYVDHLVTSNQYRLSKTEGLVVKALWALGEALERAVMVGDNYDRDVLPASKRDMFCVHYAGSQTPELDEWPIRVNSMKQLEQLIKHGN